MSASEQLKAEARLLRGVAREAEEETGGVCRDTTYHQMLLLRIAFYELGAAIVAALEGWRGGGR